MQAQPATRIKLATCDPMAAMNYKAVRRLNLLKLEADHGTLAELARAIERAIGSDDDPVTASYLSQIKGGFRAMGDKVARKIERLRPDLPEGWMDRELSTSVTRLHAAQNVAPFSPGREEVSVLPVLSWVQAGQPHTPEQGYSRDEAEESLPFIGKASRDAFLLRVRGRSMESADGSEPTFPDGCLIVVEPHLKPVHGDGVIYRLPGRDEVTFKMLSLEGTSVWLRPINRDPEYASYLVGPESIFCGTVIGKQVSTLYTRR